MATRFFSNQCIKQFLTGFRHWSLFAFHNIILLFFLFFDLPFLRLYLATKIKCYLFSPGALSNSERRLFHPKKHGSFYLTPSYHWRLLNYTFLLECSSLPHWGALRNHLVSIYHRCLFNLSFNFDISISRHYFSKVQSLWLLFLYFERPLEFQIALYIKLTRVYLTWCGFFFQKIHQIFTRKASVRFGDSRDLILFYILHSFFQGKFDILGANKIFPRLSEK